MPEKQKVLHFCTYKLHINICKILVMGWVWETETVRQQNYLLGDWWKIGPLSNMLHSSLTPFQTNKPKHEKPLQFPITPPSSSCINENIQTKIKDGNKAFPKKLDAEEVILFVCKELHIWNSYSSIQSGLLQAWFPVARKSSWRWRKNQVLLSLLPKLLLNEEFIFYISIWSEW